MNAVAIKRKHLKTKVVNSAHFINDNNETTKYIKNQEDELSSMYDIERS